MNWFVLSLIGGGAYVLMKSPAAKAAPIVPVTPAATKPSPAPAPKPAPSAPVQPPAHPNWNIPDGMLSGVPAALVTNIDQAYAAGDPIALAAWIPSLKKLHRPDLAGIVQQDVQTMTAPKVSG